MSGSIIIPSISNYSNYSYTNSVVPSSVLTSYSLPSHDAPYHDDEPDYPLNYEASPIDNGVNANTTDGLPSSIYHTNVEATVTSELLSSVNDTQSPSDNGATARYQHMKMKYLRSAGIVIPSTATATARVPSSPSYDNEASDVADVSGPSSSSSSPLSSTSSIMSSSAACVTPVTKSASVGLLARLLSERSSAATSPASLSPSSSSTSLSGMTSSPKSSDASLSPSSSTSSFIIPTYVRRTSPISIPKRVVSSSSRDVEDGVRYRRARQLTRDDLEEEERDRQRYAAVNGVTTNGAGVHASRRSVDVDGEFSFADVFAAPLASSSRPMAMKSVAVPVAVSSRRVAAVSSYQSSSYSMMAASHALPSSLIDGFLAL